MSSTTQTSKAGDRFKTRFADVNEEGFLAAAETEVVGIIGDYQGQLALQKSVNRRILVAAVKRQIEVAGADSFAFGHFLDWRGRDYANGAGLAPQGKDAGRGCLMAAEGARLGISGLRHLICGVATTLGWNGIDKAGMRRRVRAVVGMVRDGSLARIVEQAANGEGFEWRMAEEPTQFLALASDLMAALRSGNAFDYKSAVFVGYDATCSGLQILSAVTGCMETAALVNVVPRADGLRADIYLSCADALKTMCAEIVGGLDVAEAEAAMEANTAGDHWALYWHRAGVTRAVTKRPVMVYCYGGTKRTFQGAIREETRAPWKACVWLAAALYDGVLATLLPKAHAFMIALQGMARSLAKVGKPVAFTAADGLPFMQATMETTKKQVRCQLAGDRDIYVVTQKRTKTLNSQRQASGIAPNVVHHWDALFLRNVVRAFAAAGISHFFTVHDCFYLRPGDWAKGWKIIREVFVETFSGDVAGAIWQQIEDVANGEQADAHLIAWAAETGAEYAQAPKLITLPPCPTKGDLDLTGALRSEFLFS